MKLAGRKATLIYIIIEKSVISQGPGYFINVSGFCLFVCGGVCFWEVVFLEHQVENSLQINYLFVTSNWARPGWWSLWQVVVVMVCFFVVD